MAHFAEIDENNIVLRVLVVGDDQEHRGQEFLADEIGLGGRWIKEIAMQPHFTGLTINKEAAHRLLAELRATELRYGRISLDATG